jgi:anti-sigma regulatory factor (Ser/Thr protein kinase)
LVGKGIDSTSEGAEAAALVLSELVTNAVLHAGGPIVITVDLDDHVGVRLTVADPSPERPTPGDPDADQVGGHGLGIVARCSRAWGVRTLDGRSGKSVWADIDL